MLLWCSHAVSVLLSTSQITIGSVGKYACKICTLMKPHFGITADMLILQLETAQSDARGLHIVLNSCLLRQHVVASA